MENLKMHSLDGVQRNIELIGKLFPNAITEVKRDGKVEHAIDFDVLRQELSDSIVEGREERYQFTWPDKKKAMLAANAPITATLRPVVADSVGKDGTPGGFDSENLYIEGDNLEVLKLLQETYLGKVKMIYIDPPYNTGNDFVYNDEFGMRSEEWNPASGNFDEEGNQLVGKLELNTESNGRFHTDWLNMIYPRLRLAKDLLADDGVIFISIDEHEVENLRKIGEEVYGEDNFIAQLVIVSNLKGRNDSKNFAVCHEYLLAFGKAGFSANGLPLTEEQRAAFNLSDEDGNRYQLRDLRKRGNADKRSDRPLMYFPIYYNQQNKEISLTKKDGFIEIVPRLSSGEDGRWRWGKDRVQSNLSIIEPAYSERTQKWNVNYRIYLDPKLNPLDDNDDEEKTSKAKTVWSGGEISSDVARRTLKSLLGCAPFDFPKAVSLIKKIIQIGADRNSIILDFFSGSATTAHAVMQLNAEDGGHRKFIMVQLPEKTDEKSEAYKAGYKNICEIGKERIRRAGKQILSAGGGQLSMDEVQPDVNSSLHIPNSSLDTGFRCLRLDDSNMKPVYYTPEEVSQQDMFSLVDNVKEDRTPEDLLFQVMLDLGVLLSSPIEVKEIAGKKVFNVADGFLLACFDHDVTEETVKAIAQMKPYYAVFRDSSMANDSVATNFDQIFETYSPETVRKVL